MGQGYRKDRRFPRTPAEHAVMVRLLGGPRFEGFAKTRVIGLGGCMFVNRESLGYGSPVGAFLSGRGGGPSGAGRQFGVIVSRAPARRTRGGMRVFPRRPMRGQPSHLRSRLPL